MADSRVSFTGDAAVFGYRLRHFRSERGLTLKEVGARVGKRAPYLSQIETGKKEPNLSLINALARVLEVGVADLLEPTAPSRRSELEIAVAKAQQDPLWRRELELGPLTPSARLPTAVLEHVVRLFDELKARTRMTAQTPEGARRGNASLRADMRARDNYFSEIERVAADALEGAGYSGDGPVSQRVMDDLAKHFGFTVWAVRDLPSSVRSLTDLRNERIYIPQRDEIGIRLARSVVFQTLGHFALGHEDPRDFGEFLRQRVEANYFAGAILVPEKATAPFLAAAKKEGDIAVEDLEEHFNVSYEMAAHRFTNLATHHFGLHVHFIRSDEDGVIWKAYENDGVPFPVDADGAIEGLRLCRHWGSRRAFGSDSKFSVHYQRTETPEGAYWCSTYLEAERSPHHSVTIGVRDGDARFFRGRQTERRARSQCPDGPCCRRPSPELTARWDGHAWASPRPRSHVFAALPAGTFPGVDLSEAYDFLARHAPT